MDSADRSMSRDVYDFLFALLNDESTQCNNDCLSHFIAVVSTSFELFPTTQAFYSAGRFGAADYRQILNGSVHVLRQGEARHVAGALISLAPLGDVEVRVVIFRCAVFRKLYSGD
jgi:hypothetical protein